MDKREFIAQELPDAPVMAGYDECIIGIALSASGTKVVAYDTKKVLKKNIELGMTEAQSMTFFKHEQLGAFHGDQTPVFIHPLDDEPVKEETALVKAKTAEVVGALTQTLSERVEQGYITIEEFISFGLLQEVNRIFFHPIGMSMDAHIDNDPALSYIKGVLDCRDDPTGLAFERGYISQEKIDNVGKLHLSKVDERCKLFGSAIQPVVLNSDNF